MIHNDRCITSDKRKPEIFLKQYACVNKIDMFNEDRTENKNLKIRFRELRRQVSSVPEFTEVELRDALKVLHLPFNFLKMLTVKVNTLLRCGTLTCDLSCFEYFQC